jgi:hypothetical protein
MRDGAGDYNTRAGRWGGGSRALETKISRPGLHVMYSLYILGYLDNEGYKNANKRKRGGCVVAFLKKTAWALRAVDGAVDGVVAG